MTTSTTTNAHLLRTNFSNKERFFKDLVKETGILINDAELQALQNVYRDIQQTNEHASFTWDEFYNEGFLPAYQENFRQEMIARGRQHSHSLLNELDAYEAGVQSLSEAMFGTQAEDLDTWRIGKLVGQASCIFGGISMFKYAIDPASYALAGLGSILAVVLTVVSDNEVSLEKQRAADAEALLRMISENKPLRFNGYEEIN